MLEQLNCGQAPIVSNANHKWLWIVQLSHDNGGDLAAVINLFCVLGAPVAVEK